ncbi:MAG: MFS transporter [Acidimicrobiia bacterium]
MDPVSGSPKRVPLLLYAATAFEALGYGAIFALLAELQDEYHLPTYGLGLIAGTSFLAGLGAQMGLARYADRGYTRLLLRLGLAVAAIGMLWFGLASQLWEFVGARLLLGLGSGMFGPAARRVVVARSGAKAGEALGRLASVEVAGFISGPPIAALLAGLFGLHAPFLVLAGALAITSPAVARIEEPPVGAESPKRALRVLVANRGVRSGLALAAALYLSIGVFDATWARYMTDLGASTTVIAVTLALFALPLVALSPFGGRLADRKGPLRSGVVALALTVPLIAGYGISDSVIVASLIALVHSVFDAVSTPSGQAAVARAAPASLTAAGQGLYAASAATAAGLAAFGAAPLYGAAGAEAMWGAAAGGVAMLTTLAFFWGRGTAADRPAEPETQAAPG